MLTMNQTLPSLKLNKSKELYLFNAPCATSEFSSPLSDYDVRNIIGATVNEHLERLLSENPKSFVSFMHEFLAQLYQIS